MTLKSSQTGICHITSCSLWITDNSVYYDNIIYWVWCMYVACGNKLELLEKKQKHRHKENIETPQRTLQPICRFDLNLHGVTWHTVLPVPYCVVFIWLWGSILLPNAWYLWTDLEEFFKKKLNWFNFVDEKTWPSFHWWELYQVHLEGIS